MKQLIVTADDFGAALAVNEAVEARGFFLKTGVGGFVAPNVQVAGEYELSTQNGAGDIHSGRLRITIPLAGDLPLKN